MNKYGQHVFEDLKKRLPWEKEFLQAVQEVLESISPVLDREPQYEKQRILERLVEPERIISFRTPWKDDRGTYHINRGYRVEFNSAIGPYTENSFSWIWKSVCSDYHIKV